MASPLPPSRLQFRRRTMIINLIKSIDHTIFAEWHRGSTSKRANHGLKRRGLTESSCGELRSRDLVQCEAACKRRTPQADSGVLLFSSSCMRQASKSQPLMLFPGTASFCTPCHSHICPVTVINKPLACLGEGGGLLLSAPIDQGRSFLLPALVQSWLMLAE